MNAPFLLAVLALVFAAVSMIPPLNTYPLLAIAVVLLAIALLIR